MSVQTDVKSKHIQTPELAVGYRTRLKGAVISPTTTAVTHAILLNNVYTSGTYTRATNTLTVTIANHGLTTGNRVWLTFLTGGALSYTYVVTVTNANVFTVTTTAAGTITDGAVNLYADVLLEVDAGSDTSFNVVIPGEGILASAGIYAGLPTDVYVTIFYG